MDFKILTPSEAFPLYKKLYQKVRTDFESFNGFDHYNYKLFRGDFKLLKNRFNLRVFAGLDLSGPRVMLTHYQAKNLNLGVLNSLGAILVDRTISNEDLEIFYNHIRNELSHIQDPVIAPLNGHMHLGLSFPSLNTKCEDITFLTSATSPSLRKFFFSSDLFSKERTFHSYMFKIKSPENELAKLNEYAIKRPIPKEYTTRKISLINLKRDVKIYHKLLSICFTEHYQYYPLTFDEEWELMKHILPLIRREYFRFLMVDGKEIAVCWFMPDYNLKFKNAQDLRNLARIQSVKMRPRRVRGIYAAILPEYRSQKQMKWLRNEIYAQMLNDGVKEIESSYIDEANINSLSYIKSTGGLPSHTFSLFRLNTV